VVAMSDELTLQDAQSGKFIAYYRVSTDKQGKSGLGLEAQRTAVTNYLNGGDWKIIAEFTEVETGKRADRPQLDAALKAARLHRAAIVVSEVDRLTRSVAFLSKLLEADVDVRFADLPQIEGPTGRFLLQQMASVAELEAGRLPIAPRRRWLPLRRMARSLVEFAIGQTVRGWLCLRAPVWRQRGLSSSGLAPGLTISPR
jgi:hypothetical protein